MSNRSLVTAGFVKIVTHTPTENKKSKKWTKKWKERSIAGSMGSVRRKMSASFVIKKIHG